MKHRQINSQNCNQRGFCSYRKEPLLSFHFPSTFSIRQKTSQSPQSFWKQRQWPKPKSRNLILWKFFQNLNHNIHHMHLSKLKSFQKPIEERGKLIQLMEDDNGIHGGWWESRRRCSNRGCPVDKMTHTQGTNGRLPSLTWACEHPFICGVLLENAEMTKKMTSRATSNAKTKRK